MRSRSLLLMSTMFAAMAAGAAPSAVVAEEAERPGRLEILAGSDIPRVILLEQAAQRLAVEITEVREVGAKRWILLIGEVVAIAAAPGATDTGSAASAPSMLIRVAAEGEWAMNSEQALLALAPDAMALLEPGDYVDAYDPFEDDDADDDEDALLEADDITGAKVVMVAPIGGGAADRQYMARLVLASADMLPDNARYFAPIEPDASLLPGQQVFVRVASPVSGDTAKIVPYSSVIYDVAGDSWLYTNPEPLVFVRHKIDIEQILGGVVALSAGPEAGTRIVSVGAAELMGVEQKIGN